MTGAFLRTAWVVTESTLDGDEYPIVAHEDKSDAEAFIDTAKEVASLRDYRLFEVALYGQRRVCGTCAFQWRDMTFGRICSRMPKDKDGYEFTVSEDWCCGWWKEKA